LAGAHLRHINLRDNGLGNTSLLHPRPGWPFCKTGFNIFVCKIFPS